ARPLQIRISYACSHSWTAPHRKTITPHPATGHRRARSGHACSRPQAHSARFSTRPAGHCDAPCESGPVAPEPRKPASDSTACRRPAMGKNARDYQIAAVTAAPAHEGLGPRRLLYELGEAAPAPPFVL